MDTKVQAKKEGTLIAAYGTLRLDRGNYNYLLKGRSEHLGTFKTEPRFTMYGKGAGFPVVADHGDTSIVYDLFRVNDTEVLDSVHALEGCSGVKGHPSNWYDIEYIDTPEGQAIMYVQHAQRSKDSIIETGDWNNR